MLLFQLHRDQSKDLKLTNNILPYRSWQVVILLFFISPLLSFPLILVEIYNRKKYAQTLLSLFMALAAWLFPPVFDGYRHFLTFNGIADEQLLLEEATEDKFDFILFYFEAFTGYLGLTFEFVKFVLAFTCYEIIFWIFRDLNKRFPYLNNYYFQVFLLLFLSLYLSGICLGIRYTVATCFFIFGTYLLYFGNKMGYFALFAAPCMHYSFLLYIFPFLIYLKKRFIIRNWFLLLSIIAVLILINPSFLDPIVKRLFPIEFQVLWDTYVYGKWSTYQHEERNFNYFIINQLKFIPLYLLMILSFFSPSKNLFNLTKLCLIFLIFDIQLSITLYNRFLLTFKYITLIAYFINIKRLSKLWIYILIPFIFLGQFSDYYILKRALSISYEKKIVMPIPIILATTYSPNWVYDHLDDEGKLR